MLRDHNMRPLLGLLLVPLLNAGGVEEVELAFKGLGLVQGRRCWVGQPVQERGSSLGRASEDAEAADAGEDGGQHGEASRGQADG